MKYIYTSIDFKENIEIVKNKEPLLKKLKKNKFWYLLYLVGAFIVSLFVNENHEVIEKALAYYLGALIGFTFSNERDTKNKSLEKLEKVIYDIKSTIDLDINDLKKSSIVTTKEEGTYYLCDNEHTKTKLKKVVSYIGLSKKEKLIIFKQIINDYKYHNEKIEDIYDIELYLLEKEDLINEKIVNNDYSLNTEHPLIKTLCKNNKH